MRKKLFPILMAIIGLGMLTSLQACFDEPASGWGPARQAQEQREFRYGPKHEVCDATVITAWCATPTTTIAAGRLPQVTRHTAPTVHFN